MAVNFDKYASKGNEILNELGKELGFPGERELTGRILRSVLHALRNRLTFEESLQLLAQLPVALKGIYVEGWSSKHKSKRVRTVREFIEEVQLEDYPTGQYDFSNDASGEKTISIVFSVLQRHISRGEAKDIMAVLPKALKDLWAVKV
ncbi:DUF2267 domain-containing protein [Fulvivirgaceae bacterium BMA10]|uniref:DUF2267 domain-containing protein n=1 Tax=Splendidivirga corallicola TaxID=3051826 RepID=A0ABT8KWU8_9BACT|nr:DUF2267 domain-containing protein [Fulvivirgaceae bacterium BMA10]